MTRIAWNAPGDRFFDAGVDRGVIYTRDGQVIPWNGLTGVDESGAESAASYFIDGRPYLFLPKPKEYQATLKAFTYPDRFSELMGLVEVADGMYLDSQLSDSFHLSYRTMVGNDLEGIDHGYKIHLVYNATVAPQSKTFDTLSNSINPVEFAWEIQAVPVKVEGYRPTAHIIIDTRHLGEEKIAELEALIYGDDSTEPAMPEPQIVFDLLNYGDAIIITDNGDGTWTAEGSYANVYVVAPGVFRIDNVDAIDFGDGTFQVSTTIAP